MTTEHTGKQVRKAAKEYTPGPAAIQAPWRMEYLEDTSAAHTKSATDAGTFLSDYWSTPEHDARNFVIERTTVGMILLNRYPYSNGHLLIALGDPRPTLLDYDTAQRSSLWQLVDRAVDLTHRTLSPQGVNIGINQGRAAGAGVPAHLHAHVVPRWSGDVNFMSVVGQIRVIPSSLEAMYTRFRSVIEAGR
ncbi:MAG: HIT domain-containing protein [Phycisphaeraceae bacterium]|nr:HIT domain-containing protein [Phycisphaerales bacterium]MCB9859380.1 HIT domain-containing protein [Phycisphaeraceae bacterium]